MISKYQFFKEGINGLIVNSGLDIGAVYFILKDTYQEIEKMYFAQINKELMEEQENKEKSKENEQESDK